MKIAPKLETALVAFIEANRAKSLGTFTVVAATNVITVSAPHELEVNARVRFTSTTTLPAGLTAATDFVVLSVPSPTTLTVAATEAGTVIDITDTGTGTHTIYRQRLGEATLVAARSSAEVNPPFLGIWCDNGTRHKDFTDVPGMAHPRECEVKFVIKQDYSTGSYASKVGTWAPELEEILSAPIDPDSLTESETFEFSQLLRDLNPPASGPDTRTVTGLYIYGIFHEEEPSSVEETKWVEVLSLSIVAQPADPT